jgi:hypothetical protein
LFYNQRFQQVANDLSYCILRFLDLRHRTILQFIVEAIFQCNLLVLATSCFGVLFLTPIPKTLRQSFNLVAAVLAKFIGLTIHCQSRYGLETYAKICTVNKMNLVAFTSTRAGYPTALPGRITQQLCWNVNLPILKDLRSQVVSTKIKSSKLIIDAFKQEDGGNISFKISEIIKISACTSRCWTFPRGVRTFPLQKIHMNFELCRVFRSYLDWLSSSLSFVCCMQIIFVDCKNIMALYYISHFDIIVANATTKWNQTE